MIPVELLTILRCPSTGQALALAEAFDLEHVNAKAAGTSVVSDPGSNARLAAALIRADRKVLYPIRDGIPVLLVEEAIAL